MLVLKISGKAYQVFAYIKYLSNKSPDVTIGKIEKNRRKGT